MVRQNELTEQFLCQVFNVLCQFLDVPSYRQLMSGDANHRLTAWLEHTITFSKDLFRILHEVDDVDHAQP